MEINPDLIDRLSNEKEKLWCAAHEDGSKNRIHGETVAEAGADFRPNSARRDDMKRAPALPAGAVFGIYP